MVAVITLKILIAIKMQNFVPVNRLYLKRAAVS
jgi:hypothetical protein